MPIRVECGSCHAGFKAPDGSAGKKGKCPKCGEPITVPNGQAVPPDSPAMASPPPIAPASDPTKPCPSCAEPIKAAAKKCRFCGEYVDGRAASVREEGVVVTERTSKKWKAAQLIGVLAILAGALFFFLGIATSDPSNPNGLAVIGILAGMLGVSLWIASRVGAWWFHG